LPCPKFKEENLERKRRGKETSTNREQRFGAYRGQTEKLLEVANKTLIIIEERLK